MDRFLMAQADAEAQLDEAFYERVCELLNEEWNPERFDNLMEALNEECLYKYREALEFAILHNDFTEYGRLIFKAAEEYCIGKAEDQANYEFNKGLN